jgi:DNA (cytosine-5)-methyltransferase 1
VANTNARLSDGTHEEVQSRGQTFDTSSQRTDVANTERKRLEGLSEQSSTIGKQDERLLSRNESSRGQTKRTDVANADGERQQKQWGSESIQEKVSRQTTGTRSECESGWSVEPDVGRVAYGVPGRVHRLRALGNSIVPKIAEEIGKAIMKAEADDVRYQGGGAYKAMLKLFRDNLR